MKKLYDVEIIENMEISAQIYQMSFLCPEAALEAKAGQFANIYVNRAENLLPRPISICKTDKEAGLVTVVYRVVGKGTAYFSSLKKGDTLRVIAPLGNGYTITDGKRFCVMGGGIGAPPMVMLTEEIKRLNPEAVIHAYLGFSTGSILSEEFTRAGAEVFIATDDGSEGFKGNVSELLESVSGGNKYTYDAIYACGPKPMLKAVSTYAANTKALCQISMEERMACGVGACLGCAVKIQNGADWDYKKICKDGPVFNANEVIWDD